MRFWCLKLLKFGNLKYVLPKTYPDGSPNNYGEVDIIIKKRVNDIIYLPHVEPNILPFDLIIFF